MREADKNMMKDVSDGAKEEVTSAVRNSPLSEEAEMLQKEANTLLLLRHWRKQKEGNEERCMKAAGNKHAFCLHVLFYWDVDEKSVLNVNFLTVK